MKLVISAVNFTEGGTLTVLRDAVRAAVAFAPAWSVHVLVHRPGLLDVPGATEIVFPAAKRSWLRRLRCEWFEFDRLSRCLRPDVWLSLHDITPRVHAGRQYVYCHNAVPFCSEPIEGAWRDAKFLLFRSLYGWLYRCFIHRNAAIIVQQEWLRREFRRRFGVRTVIVAHPIQSSTTAALSVPHRAVGFVYPALPRIFKNMDLIGRAVEILERDPRWSGEVSLTIDGSENAYAQRIRRRYGSLRSLRFIGLQPREQMDALYRRHDALLFPSLLETWGLPLTEAKCVGLPILAADLPYARESVGSYDRVDFFDPQDPKALAELMLGHHLGEERYGTVTAVPPEQPFVADWPGLFELLLVGEVRSLAPRRRIEPTAS